VFTTRTVSGAAAAAGAATAPMAPVIARAAAVRLDSRRPSVGEAMPCVVASRAAVLWAVRCRYSLRPVSTVKIPPVLRASTGGAKEVEAEGADVGEVLNALAAQHPATASQLFSEEGELNRYVNVYLNDEDVRVLDGLGTQVGPTDTIVILPAMAGGR
jgi:sulfur-carrier protein